MRGRYQLAFLIPPDAQKILTEDDWEFSSQQFLPNSVIDFLLDTLGCVLIDKYLEVVIYTNQNTRASIFHNGLGQINYVHLQLYGDGLSKFLNLFSAHFSDQEVQVFLP